MGRLADFLRLAWGFPYWNARKSVYRLRLRGGRARCPCQHASDSGRAYETACVAVVGWDDPARFRRLCPLLKQNSAGQWRCSVDAPQVRPFWGRAFAFYGTALALAYLIATLAAFTVLRSVGFQVDYLGVLWPPAWSKLGEVRARYFLDQYRTAANAGDMQRALLALSTAYSLDPRQYAVGRQLAQVWQVGQPGMSDQVYQRLLRDHPAEAESTAQAWFRALLARGDFQQVERLSSWRIASAPDTSAAWISAFLFANERTRSAEARRELAATATLPSTARFLVRLVDDLAATRTQEDARARLLQAASQAENATTFYHVCRLLLARGLAEETLRWLDARRELLSPRDLLPLRLDALARLRWKAALHSEVETLLLSRPSPALVELLAAHLIRHPDPAVGDLLFSRLQQAPLAPGPEHYPAYLALYCAAGAVGDPARLAWVAARVREIVGGNFLGLEALGEVLLDERRSRHLENYLPAMQPLSLEITYALFDRFTPVKP